MVKLRGGTGGDFFSRPTSESATVRDIYAKKDLGEAQGTFNMTVTPMDAVLLKMTPM